MCVCAGARGVQIRAVTAGKAAREMFAATHAMECNLRGVGGVVALNYDPGVLETELVTDGMADTRMDPTLHGFFKATIQRVRVLNNLHCTPAHSARARDVGPGLNTRRGQYPQRAPSRR